MQADWMGFPGRRKLAAYMQDEDGAPSTLEFVLLLPIFMLIVALVVDLTFLFMAQARMHDVATYATRNWAVGQMTAIEADAYAESRSIIMSASPLSTGVIDGGALTMTLSMSAGNATPFGILHFVAGNDITTSVTQLREGV